MSDDKYLQAVEQAMVALRRRQTRRALAAQAGAANTPHLDVLDALEAAELDDQPATVSTVALALHVDQPRASRLVATAVEAGMVRREADQSDGRRSRLVRTARGRRISEQVHTSRRALFAHAMAGWSSAERATFARLLERFLAGLGS
jgi:DNA-binding MarR family transcriptional regulator